IPCMFCGAALFAFFFSTYLFPSFLFKNDHFKKTIFLYYITHLLFIQIPLSILTCMDNLLFLHKDVLLICAFYMFLFSFRVIFILLFLCFFFFFLCLFLIIIFYQLCPSKCQYKFYHDLSKFLKVNSPILPEEKIKNLNRYF